MINEMDHYRVYALQRGIKVDICTFLRSNAPSALRSSRGRARGRAGAPRAQPRYRRTRKCKVELDMSKTNHLSLFIAACRCNVRAVGSGILLDASIIVDNVVVLYRLEVRMAVGNIWHGFALLTTVGC